METIRKTTPNEFVLWISVPYCNLRCSFCRPNNDVPVEFMPRKELLDVIKASAECGITKIRWSGGEATLLPDLVDLVSKTRALGIKNQMLSTNGLNLSPIADQLKKEGIRRVNISLDTLDEQKFHHITKVDALPTVIKAIELSAPLFELTKINTVLTDINIVEITDLIEFVGQIRKENSQLVIRFCELYRSDSNNSFVKEHYITADRVLETVDHSFGSFTEINIEGDNPMSSYYRIHSNDVVFGVIRNASVNYKCAGHRCHKLRLNPTGYFSNCSINKKARYPLIGLSYEDKVDLIRHIIDEKRERDDTFYNKQKHFQADYDFLRFGKQ